MSATSRGIGGSRGSPCRRPLRSRPRQGRRRRPTRPRAPRTPRRSPCRSTCRRHSTPTASHPTRRRPSRRRRRRARLRSCTRVSRRSRAWACSTLPLPPLPFAAAALSHGSTTHPPSHCFAQAAQARRVDADQPAAHRQVAQAQRRLWCQGAPLAHPTRRAPTAGALLIGGRGGEHRRMGVLVVRDAGCRRTPAARRRRARWRTPCTLLPPSYVPLAAAIVAARACAPSPRPRLASFASPRTRALCSSRPSSAPPPLPTPCAQVRPVAAAAVVALRRPRRGAPARRGRRGYAERRQRH